VHNSFVMVFLMWTWIKQASGNYMGCQSLQCSSYRCPNLCSGTWPSFCYNTQAYQPTPKFLRLWNREFGNYHRMKLIFFEVK